ncbi:MAG: hypothetical protein ACE5R6_05800 [Candidatus Heimdallarchaeota archaeon]
MDSKNNGLNFVSLDNNWTSAEELTPGVNYTRTITSFDPVNYWKVFANFTQLVKAEIWLLQWVELTNPNYYDFDLFIYDQYHNELNSSTSSSNYEVVSTVATVSAWYYIEVHQYSGFGPYLLTVEITESDKTNDNYWWNAIPIDIGTYTYSGSLDIINDSIDWFSLELNPTEILKVNITRSNAQIDIACGIYDEEQNLLARSIEINDTEVASAVAYAHGVYYLEIMVIQGAGAYTLNIEVTSGGEIDDYWWAYPKPIMAGNHSGSLDLGGSDPSDWFIFQLQPAEIVQIEITFPNTQLDLDARIYNHDLQLLDESAGYEGQEKISTVATRPEIYYLELEAIWGGGNYTFSLQITPPTPISPGMYLGNLDTNTGRDKMWFTFHLSSNKVAKVRVKFPSNQTNIDVHLYTFHGELKHVDSSIGNDDTKEVFGLSFTPKTWYLLVIARWGASNYSLTLNSVPVNLIGPGYHLGILNESNQEVWYGIELQQGDCLMASLYSNRTDYDMEFYSTTGSWLVGSYLGQGQLEKVQGIAQTSGVYGIRIFRYTGAGLYKVLMTIAHPELITPGNYSGLLNASSPKIIYKVELQQNDKIIARITTPISTNLNMELFSPNGTWVAGSFKPRGYIDEVSGVAQITGTFFLCITWESGSEDYELNLNVQPDSPPLSDFAGGSPQTARKIIPGRYYDALDDIIDRHDYYALLLESGDILHVKANGWTPPVDFDLEVLAPDLSLVQGSWDTTPYETVEITAKSSGIHYLHLFSVQGSGPYTIEVRNKAGISPIPDQAGNNVNSAQTIQPGVYNEYLSIKYDSDDYYRIELEMGDNVTILIRGWNASTADFELQVLNSTFGILNTSSGIGSEEQVTFIAQTTETFYIRAFSIIGNGWYTLELYINPTKSTITTREMGNLILQLTGGGLVLVLVFCFSWKKRQKG